MNNNAIVIFVQVPIQFHDGSFLLEKQACNGLRLWADNFEHVTVCLPFVDGPLLPGWVPVDAVGPNLARISVEPVPSAWQLSTFLREQGKVRSRLRDLLETSRYLCFAIGGLIGDWGAVACWEAHRMNRPYSVWTDRVESEVTRKSIQTGPLRRRIKARMTHRPMSWLERAVIRRASLGLFHGRDTFEAYAPFSTNAQLVHDIHIGRADHISTAQLASKIAASATTPLTIVYTGRAVPMKGPHDWLSVLVALAERGVPFLAQWLGDGSELPAMQQRLAEAGLQDRVALPGFVSDRAEVLRALREAHVFLFTHLTPESPRCLIEALVSGTPIVGYDSPYARDLIEGHGGGRLVPRGDAGALADEIARLADNRSLLADLMKAAQEDGAPYDDEAVFRHRSDLIKAFS